MRSPDYTPAAALALLDAAAGADGARIIADLFLKAGLAVPLQIMVPFGKDLTDSIKEGMTS